MTYRVVQWATGAMGTAVLRCLIDHPSTEVAGVLVYNEEKAGVDAGTLAKRPPTGVLATTDPEAILALDADVVVHAGRLSPYGAHDDEIVRLLESGKNVISLNSYSYPAWNDPARRERLEAACAQGGVSLMGAGLNPGFIAEQLAVVASGLCLRIDNLEIVEAADSREIRNPHYLFDMLGFGAALDAHDPNDPDWGPTKALNGMYDELLATVALRLGMTIDRIETEHTLLPAVADITLPAGVVSKGTVGHTRWRWHAIVGGERRLTMTINWFVETAHLDSAEPPLWRLAITGHPGVKISVDLEKHVEDRSRMGAEQYAVGAQVIHAIPDLVAAPPGIVVHPVATPYRVHHDPRRCGHQVRDGVDDLGPDGVLL
ncbi:hypothetical protein, partial [Nocardioides sp.]|uniref:NAD(P)H-dependent amine dehydrogenase family protein n=1 Tax=Nocardioides sp. TaxID=35761 RepID=UPI0039E47ED9